MRRSILKVLVAGLVTALVGVSIPAGIAHATVDDIWFVSQNQGLTAAPGNSNDCDNPDVVVNTAVSSSDLTAFFAGLTTFATVVFCAGTYLISETIEITHDINIFGVGPMSAGEFNKNVILDGKGANQIMRIVGNASAAIFNFVMRNGSATNSGSVVDCATGHSCGGALAIDTSGMVVVANMEFRDNAASGMGGAIGINGGTALVGGDVETCLSDPTVCRDAQVTISNSTFVGNSAYDGGAIGTAYLNVGDIQDHVMFENSTFYDNAASNEGDAVGIAFSYVSMRNNTVVEPTWPSHSIISGDIDLTDNIIAVQGGTNNGAVSCKNVNDLGGNIALDSSCDFSAEWPGWDTRSLATSYIFEAYADLHLTDLGYFGDGTTEMIAITQYSPAQSFGHAYADCPVEDQRSANRSFNTDDSYCDAGAFERETHLFGQLVDGDGYGFNGDGTSASPEEVPIGGELNINDLSGGLGLLRGRMYDEAVDKWSDITFPYTDWSVGNRHLIAMHNWFGFYEPYEYDLKYVYPYSWEWNDCTLGQTFCIESATISHDGSEVDLRHTNYYGVWGKAQFLDGGNAVTSFNWWLDGDIPEELLNDTVTLVLHTGELAPRMTTSYSNNLQITVDDSGGYNKLTITGKPTEINWLAGADIGYSACASSGSCGDDTTRSSMNDIVFSGNSQDLHTWGTDADKFAGFYSAQNAQFGPSVSVLALQFAVYPDPYWELTLGNPHLDAVGDLNTGKLNAWMPGAYFESLETTAAAAAAVGFTVISNETIGSESVTRVIPADVQVVDGGLMLTIDSIGYSTNKIRVYNVPDSGIGVTELNYGGNQTHNGHSAEFSFLMDRDVTGLTDSDLEINPASTATGCSVSAEMSGTTEVLAHVTGCTSDGTVGVRLKANSLTWGSDTGPSNESSSPFVTLDNRGPLSYGLQTSAKSPNKASTIAYTITFDETIMGLTGADFVNLGTATGCQFSPNASTGTSFTISVTHCSKSGTLQLKFLGTGVTDVAENIGSVATSTKKITLDRVKPSLKATVFTPLTTTSRTLLFTISATNRPEQLNCASITAADFVITAGRFVRSTISGTSCLIAVSSTVASGIVGQTTVAKARSLKIADKAGNLSSAIAALPLAWRLVA